LKYDLKVNNYELYQTAFTHTSYANENNVKNNERLEFLGDAILNFCFSEYLYRKYPNLREGEMTKIRATYVCEQANAEYSLKLGLDKLLLLGKGEEEQNGRSKPSVLGDLFEAFLGAVYLDSSLEKVKEIINDLVLKEIDTIKEDGFFLDYKSTLQEYVQAETKKSVTYVLVKEEGPSHDKLFTTFVYYEKIKLGEGIGKSKKESEQNAAKAALEKLAKWGFSYGKILWFN